MDVRCERCQTEYEVEDASVSDLGTEVQCSDCGHLFMVKRPAGATSAAGAPASNESQAAGWQLVTTFGQSHDVRDLTQLHKWIVERRVTRNDKISQDGQSWQTLGSMAELVPFFDIVDSAERARIIDTLPVAPLAPLQPPILTPREVEPPVDATKPGQSAPQLLSPYVLGGSAGDSLGALPQATDVGETEMIAARPARARKALKVAVMVAVAGAIGYGGIVWQRQYFHPAAISSSANGQASVGQAKVHTATAPAESAPAARAGEDTEADEVADRGHAPVVEPLDGEAAAEGNGAIPQSAAAQGYSALHRHEYAEAIAFFKEALGEKPGNGTALFGLAEAYRGAGKATHALQTYRRYVKGLPAGPDAGSARFHIRTLEKKVKQRGRDASGA